MKCPHCGHDVESSQRRWQLRMKAQGRCIICAQPKKPADETFEKCRGCRVKDSARGQRRYRRLHPSAI